MALALNKTTLKQQRDQLKTFKRFLTVAGLEAATVASRTETGS
jgi:hypothetical protein